MKNQGSFVLELCMFLFSRLGQTTYAWKPTVLAPFSRPSVSCRKISKSHLFTTMAPDSSTSTDPLTQRGLPSPLILGSASFTRKLILKEMGIPYHILVRPIDEKGLGDRSRDIPADLVLTLGKAKMLHLVDEIKAGRCQKEIEESFGTDESGTHMIVLTGDQVVTCDGEILEKPESIEEARSFVSRYGRTPPSTVGSCVLTHLPSGIQVSGTDTATIHFKVDTPATLVDKLVAKGEPILSCAGGLMVEHPDVKEYVASIDGTEDSVMGLSKDLVIRLLDDLALKLNRS